jgi:PST family polysaccharide transporter
MGSTILLARLLMPSDFGLIAMVTAITGFVAKFKDAGLSTATVQRKDITHDQVSTLFWINVALSAAVMLVVAAMAPLIGAFYSEPRLVWVTLALAATMVFGGLTVQHQALLRRQMRFKALAVVEISSMAGGVSVAIVMAILDFGYWSLVGMIGGAAVINAAMVWVLCDWRPGLPKRGSGVGQMVKFGGGLTGFSFLNYFTRNTDNIVIGFALGSGPLGIYSKAYQLLSLPISQINAPVASVMLPALSRLQDNPRRYRRAYLRALSAIAIVGMPIVVCAFLLADEAVAILLGPGWEQAAEVFRWLAPAALFGTVNVAPGWLCVSLGRAGTQLRWAVISAPLTVIAFLVGVRWGVTGVAAAFSVSWCIGFYIFVAMACHGSPVRQSDIGRALVPPLSASAMSLAIGLAFYPIVVNIVPASAMSLAVGLTFFPIVVDIVLSPFFRVMLMIPLVGIVYASVLWTIPASREMLNRLALDGLRSAIFPGKDIR